MDYLKKIDLSQLQSKAKNVKNLNESDLVHQEIQRRMKNPAYAKQLNDLEALNKEMELVQQTLAQNQPSPQQQRLIHALTKDSSNLEVQKALSEMEIPRHSQLKALASDYKEGADTLQVGKSMPKTIIDDEFLNLKKSGVSNNDLLSAYTMDALNPNRQYTQEAVEQAGKSANVLMNTPEAINKANTIYEHIAGAQAKKELAKNQLRRGMDPSIQKQMPFNEAIERLNKYLSSKPIQKVFNNPVTKNSIKMLGPAAGIGLALATGDASAAMPMGFDSEPVGEGSDITPQSQLDRPAEGGYMSPERLKRLQENSVVRDRLNNIFKK